MPDLCPLKEERQPKKGMGYSQYIAFVHFFGCIQDKNGWSRWCFWSIHMHLWYVFVLMDIHHIVDDSPIHGHPTETGAFRKPGNTMLLTPFLLTDALVGKAKPHVLLVDFGLAEIFDEQVGPEFWRWTFFCFGVFLFYFSGVTFRCWRIVRVLLRQILFKQDTILVNQHSFSWKLHLGRTYIYFYRPSERALFGVPRILEEFDWWKWASYCNQKPSLLGQPAWGAKGRKIQLPS